MSHFFMGAINIKTNKHEPSFCASKEYTYKCPECDKKVKFCKGKIKQPYFSHYKSDNPCVFYQKPSESHIHKEAKRLLKHVIDSQYPIQMVKTCESCDEMVSRDILYSKDMNCKLEYKFDFCESKKSADVAIIDNNGIIQYIFEIYHTHKTSTKNRPEPWFEIKAQEFIQFLHQLLPLQRMPRMNMLELNLPLRLCELHPSEVSDMHQMKLEHLCLLAPCEGLLGKTCRLQDRVCSRFSYR